MKQIYTLCERVCACACAFLLLTIPAKTSRSIWTECFVTKWNECKISNNQMIYPFCTDVYVEFVCQSHTVFSSLLLLQNEWKKKSKSLNWSKRQTRAFHTKEICHIHRYISFYCSVFLFLVLFSPIEFFLVGDFISSLVFLCNAQFNKPLWVDELCHYLLRFAASDCLRLCACVCVCSSVR